jgi:hypothetical protein
VGDENSLESSEGGCHPANKGLILTSYNTSDRVDGWMPLPYYYFFHPLFLSIWMNQFAWIPWLIRYDWISFGGVADRLVLASRSFR